MQGCEARQLMRPADAAEYLGVASQTLSRWRVEGRPPMFLKIGGLVRYDIVDLNRFLDSAARRSTCDSHVR